MTPPPTPVPIVTMTILLYSLPPPIQNSPSAAILASLPILTGIPVSSDNTLAALNTPQPKLIHLLTVPSSRQAPGSPIPIPATSSVVIFISTRTPLIYSLISGRIRLPPSSFLVGISSFLNSSPSSENVPHLQVVPPTSIPNIILLIVILPASHKIFLYSSV